MGAVSIEWEGPPLIEGGASVPALWLSEGFHLTGDLDQDGADETVVYLTYSSGGTGNFGYLAVMDREDGDIVQKVHSFLIRSSTPGFRPDAKNLGTLDMIQIDIHTNFRYQYGLGKYTSI